MKYALFLLLFTSVTCKAQDGDYYKTPQGWKIEPGDEIVLGKGSMPNKTFAFIYQSPVGFVTNTSGDNWRKRPLLSQAAGKSVKVKRFTETGNKRIGYTTIAVVGVGEMTNYWIEIDNAIDAGEIIPPEQYRPAVSKPASSISVADELKKLKALKDDGTLTEEEYQAQKKKLLQQ